MVLLFLYPVKTEIFMLGQTSQRACSSKTPDISLWKLTVNNVKMDVLSTDTIEYYFAQFFCVPPTGTIYQNPTLSVVRRRLVGEGFVEEVTVMNHSTQEQAIEVDLRAGADFAD